MENYGWKLEGEDDRNLTTENYLNVLVDNSWRGKGIEFYSIDVWDFNRLTKSESNE